jgi:amino acid transporter
MKKKLVLLVISILFVITSLVLFITSMEFYNEDGWKGIDTDRDYLFIFISSIFILVMGILNYKDRSKYNKEIKYTGYACLSLNVLYGLYGLIKVFSKGVEEIYAGNQFTINVEDLITYIVWFTLSIVATIILYYINKKNSLAC